MALKCGIVGLPNSGKTTIFNCFSNTKGEVTNYSFSTNKSNLGTIKVPDPRLQKLEEFQPTEQVVQTVVDIVDIPGLAKGAGEGEGLGNKFLDDLRYSDAIIHVVRCFEDENLPHDQGDIDPVRDIETIDMELQVKDLEAVERKIERLKKVAKSGDKEAIAGIEFLSKVKNHLEELNSVRNFEMTKDEAEHIEDLNLLTVKPVLYVMNIDEDSAASGNEYTKTAEEFLKDEDTEIFYIAAELEADIAELEEEQERIEFLKDAGLEEPGVAKLLRSAYAILDLNTFFTIGPKEIRAWTIKEGATAPEAAGVIHSDLEKGFIRAEVIAYDDFISLGSEQKCKEEGKLRLEGKKYIVKDGDLLNIRFNV
ncbi:MAG: redox-regulated ATPase YchF [Bacteroidota bacterium]|nr:redox-regulated ATPase YchF [Bacteroidota bacterium]